ncbi:MAG TPA: MBL fold metallo-hydrolase [Methylomirabilota bacterium]|nr:MBL fold metallo-hydrolase [Methylomirabilota bacterium]
MADDPSGLVLTPKRVTDRVYYVEGATEIASRANRAFNSNAGFVVTEDTVLVVDALGAYPLGVALVRAIRQVTPKPITRVVVTHYHADHFYGLRALKEAGAEVWAHVRGREYLDNDSQARLEQRRRDLGPWVDEQTRLVPADRWLPGDARFVAGGLDFDVVYMGPAHAPDDEMLVVRQEQVVFCGDIIVSGRLPFVGDADSKHWLVAIDRLLAMKPPLMIPGHGPVSRDPARDLAFTRDYLLYLRQVMGKAVADMVPFDEAYAQTDWSRYARVPTFEPANRINAYGTYLLMERESLGK